MIKYLNLTRSALFEVLMENFFYSNTFPEFPFPPIRTNLSHSCLPPPQAKLFFLLLWVKLVMEDSSQRFSTLFLSFQTHDRKTTKVSWLFDALRICNQLDVINEETGESFSIDKEEFFNLLENILKLCEIKQEDDEMDQAKRRVSYIESKFIHCIDQKRKFCGRILI